MGNIDIYSVLKSIA